MAVLPIHACSENEPLSAGSRISNIIYMDYLVTASTSLANMHTHAHRVYRVFIHAYLRTARGTHVFEAELST